MWGNRNFLFLFVMSFLIDQSFSSFSWHLDKVDETEIIRNARNNRKEKNVYRGILLSYSTHAKNVICEDRYHAQLYDKRNYFREETFNLSGKDTTEPTSGEEAQKNIVRSEVEPTIDLRVTDDPTNDGNPTHALVVKKLTIEDRALTDEEDIFFPCAIRGIKSRKPDDEMYLLSFAFSSRWFYISTLDNKHENHARLRQYMSISPEYVDLETAVVEQKYLNMRETMETLKMESPRYVELIEKQDDLSALTRWQKLMLCGSILSSPIYRDMFHSSLLEVSIQWVIKSKSNLKYRIKDVVFSSSNLKDKKIKADCMYCRGYEHFLDFDTKDWTDMCITRSYDDKSSVYVLEADNDSAAYYMTKYFTKVPALINAREKMTNGAIFYD